MFDDAAPVEAVVDVLRRELPGFATQIDPATNAIRIRTTLRVGHMVGLEVVLYPVAHGADPEEVAAPLIDKARREAIAQLGIEKMIAERERIARERGHAGGYLEGITKGRAEGRAAAIREFADAMRAEGAAADDD